MMDNRFNNRDFEQFVKQNADQYRMFPSEKVWEGIHNTLHTRRKWYGIGLALLILTTTAVTLVMMNSAQQKQITSVNTAQPVIEQLKASHPSADAEAAIKPTPVISPAKPIAHNTSRPAHVPAGTNSPATIFVSDLAINSNNENFLVPAATTETINAETAPVAPTVTAVAVPARSKPAVVRKPGNTIIAQVQPKEPVPVTVIIADDSEPTTAVAKNTMAPAKQESMYPLTIESVVNSYVHIRRPKRLSWQVFITPTVSYRKLKENKPFLDAARQGASGTLIAQYTPDINSIVIHRPDIGFQLGFMAGYPLSKRLSITGGLQFNTSKYDIRAYNSPSEVATIALSNAPGGSSSVSTYTNYRNIGGYKADWLHNLCFSASAPVGLEFKLSRNPRSYVGVGATIQPTYTLGNRAYLISTDFKNYAEIPELTRKWNINTGFELFAATTTGKIQWRVGPQVRYQTMSSFVEKYPIKEHLFDFGLKLGIMLK